MPKLLPQRLRSHSIAEFRAAAKHRLIEGRALASADQRVGAIYVLGYVAEMELKAAFFALAGFGLDQPIAMRDLHNARNNARQWGMAWPGNLHNVSAWADLVVFVRRRIPHLAYPPGFAQRVLATSREIARRWQPALRYHSNLAYRHEVRVVAEAAEWYVEHELDL